MDILTILLIALGLSMDAFAVAVASGFTIKRQRVNHALRISFFFGGFQALMPVIGWAAGLGARGYISGIDHWVAFGLLCVIGVKMIYESTKMDGKKKTDEFNIYMLLMLSIATSIDALAVGLSLSLLNVFIVTPALIIGAVTFALSFSGVFIGSRSGHFFEKKIEALGGLILIGIGVKILIEHLI